MLAPIPRYRAHRTAPRCAAPFHVAPCRAAPRHAVVVKARVAGGGCCGSASAGDHPNKRITLCIFANLLLNPPYAAHQIRSIQTEIAQSPTGAAGLATFFLGNDDDTVEDPAEEAAEKLKVGTPRTTHHAPRTTHPPAYSPTTHPTHQRHQDRALASSRYGAV